MRIDSNTIEIIDGLTVTPGESAKSVRDKAKRLNIPTIFEPNRFGTSAVRISDARVFDMPFTDCKILFSYDKLNCINIKIKPIPNGKSMYDAADALYEKTVEKITESVGDVPKKNNTARCRFEKGLFQIETAIDSTYSGVTVNIHAAKEV